MFFNICPYFSIFINIYQYLSIFNIYQYSIFINIQYLSIFRFNIYQYLINIYQHLSIFIKLYIYTLFIIYYLSSAHPPRNCDFEVSSIPISIMCWGPDGIPRQETASLLRFEKVGAQWMALCGDLVGGFRRFHVVYCLTFFDLL